MNRRSGESTLVQTRADPSARHDEPYDAAFRGHVSRLTAADVDRKPARWGSDDDATRLTLRVLRETNNWSKMCGFQRPNGFRRRHSEYVRNRCAVESGGLRTEAREDAYDRQSRDRNGSDAQQ